MGDTLEEQGTISFSTMKKMLGSGNGKTSHRTHANKRGGQNKGDLFGAYPRTEVCLIASTRSKGRKEERME